MTEFNYDGLFAQRAPITLRGENRNARYDFAVAYPDPDTLPLEGLSDALRVALEREGRGPGILSGGSGLSTATRTCRR